MSLLLKQKEKCKYSDNCPYNNNGFTSCRGADSNRESTFLCDFVSETGVFTEGKFRNQFDTTGKMVIINE